MRYFNPRSSCEERRRRRTGGRHCEISIHAPHARSDVRKRCIEVAPLDISIHAPHARSDLIEADNMSIDKQFQSTLLMRGATPSWYDSLTNVRRFQSTLLMRGATAVSTSVSTMQRFQSTLLMRGATSSICVKKYSENFNPRSSCEERPASLFAISSAFLFQSTLLMRGATLLDVEHFDLR